MSGPGLALFYGGLVRKKNILGTMMQTFAMMAVITVLWALVTYSLAFGSRQRLHRRPAQRLPARRRPRAGQGLRRHHSAADLHGLPAHVRHHHARADHRRLRRAHEVLRDAGLHGPLGDLRLQPDGAHGLGQGRPAERRAGRQVPLPRLRGRHRRSRHLRRLRAWSPRSTSASASATPRCPCRRTRSCSASSAPACSG